MDQQLNFIVINSQIIQRETVIIFTLFSMMVSQAFSQNEGYYWLSTSVTYATEAQMDSMKAVVREYQPRMLEALKRDRVVLDEIALFGISDKTNQALFLHKL